MVGIASLVFNLGAGLVAIVLWLTRNRASGATANATLGTRMEAQGREIGELKKRLDDMADSHQLVARLEERINALTSIQTQLPAIISESVEKGIRAALGAVLAGAKRAA